MWHPTGACCFVSEYNLGDVLIEGDDILGDGVNVAARLEGVAEPAGICVSSSAYEQVRGKVAVEFIDLGEQTLKNIARPIRAYAVVGDSLGSDRQATPAMPIAQSIAHLSIVVLPLSNIALHLVPDHALAHMYIDFVQISTNRPFQGIAECRRALELDRNLAMAHGFIGLAKYFSGLGEETVGHIQEAYALVLVTRMSTRG